MFDIGFWEITLIMVVALLVIGPERLPALARKAGILVGKGRRFVQGVKDDIDRELAADELKRILKEQGRDGSIKDSLQETLKETRSTLEDAKQDFELKAIDDPETPAADSSTESLPKPDKKPGGKKPDDQA